MDIAFDMDEFFRQNDPQYAAEHPEAHAAKEALYENLMAGRISALDEKLAALGQTQEDYLPSEIEKFKDATGYEEFLDFDPAEVKAALEDPNRSRVDEMLAAAEKAEREYAAEAAAYVQTPAAIVEQARAAQGEPVGSFSIYQLKGGNETLDYRFEPLDSIHRNGLSVKPENYELVYEAPMTAKDAFIPGSMWIARRTSPGTPCRYRISWCCIRTGRIPPITATALAFPKCRSFCSRRRKAVRSPSASRRPGAASISAA